MEHTELVTCGHEIYSLNFIVLLRFNPNSVVVRKIARKVSVLSYYQDMFCLAFFVPDPVLSCLLSCCTGREHVLRK